MLNPEAFRRQLNQVDQELAEKRQADQRGWDVRKAKQQQDAEETQERVSQQQLEAGEEERQKNQAVLEMDSQLPIKAHLEILREKIAPEQKIQRWGPVNGEVAYSLVYEKKKRIIQVAQPAHGLTARARVLSGIVGPDGTTLKDTVDVFGLCLNDQGRVLIRNRRCAESPYFEKGINPLTWQPQFDYEMREQFPHKNVINDQLGARLAKEEISHLMGEFDVNSGEGPQQIAQILTTFYKEVKTSGHGGLVGIKTGKLG